MIKYRSTKGGFTLIELMAVMGIMLIMATIAITSYRSMLSGSGITASLGHLRQSMALARQQAIMQGKSAYVVFSQESEVSDANRSGYVTCMAEGKNVDDPDSGYALEDLYRSDWGQVKKDSILYNLSEDNPTSSKVLSIEPDGGRGVPRIKTEKSMWGAGCRYGWEISQRIMLPRGFVFSESPPPAVRFKPDGTASGAAQGIEIYEQTRPNNKYTVNIKIDGSTEVTYN